MEELTKNETEQKKERIAFLKNACSVFVEAIRDYANEVEKLEEEILFDPKNVIDLDKLSVRAKNRLEHADIKLWSQVDAMTDYELLKLRYLGKKTLEELRWYSAEAKEK